MKNLLLLTFLTILMSTLTTDLIAQNTSYLMIRAVESFDQAMNKLTVTENGAVLEEIDLETFGRKTPNVNQVEINKTLDKYASGGYSLVEMTTGGASSGLIIVTTFVLKKE